LFILLSTTKTVYATISAKLVTLIYNFMTTILAEFIIPIYITPPQAKHSIKLRSLFLIIINTNILIYLTLKHYINLKFFKYLQ